MKITYIFHSGFSVEFDDVVLIFDYYKGRLPKFPKDKKIFVFASHFHQDHFDRKIFELSEEYENVTYILSNDIPGGFSKAYSHSTHRIGKNKNLGLDDMDIMTLASTDEGVAFVVKYHGKSIFHAGDLHWWSWLGEDESVNDEMGEKFKAQIDKLKDMHFDAAFMLLDPRLEERYWWGMDYFMTHTLSDHVFPMHMWEKYEIIRQFKALDVSREYKDKIVEIHEESESFEI